MKKIKRTLFRLIFALEIVGFTAHYFLGAQGLQKLAHARAETTALTQELAQLDAEITLLNQEIIAWNTNPFYKEKVAREELQMARADEHIFYRV
jgi:cell division protein FtsB